MSALLERPPMAKGRSKPKSQNGTDLVKIDPALVEKLGWIVKLRKAAGQKGFTNASYLEPLIRTSIERDYRVIEKDVEAIKQREAAGGKKLQEQDRAEAE